MAFDDTVAAPAARALYGDELAAGALVGDYVIERACYRGPAASVYRATQAQHGRPAAVKVLSAASCTSTQLLRRFEQEADALNRLHHRHIVEILGHGALRDGRPFIAMQWIEGRNLYDELRARGMLSPAEAVALGEQVGAALTAAHAIGIVHRDLKPQNVMATPHGQWLHLTLVDFGVAKLVDGDRRRADALTSTGMVIGTPLSMAPEQVRGEPVDLRADIYALGVLLFQCLTGRPPFAADTIVEIEELHLHAPPPDPCALAPIPERLGAVVLRCLEKRPERRFESVDEVVAALRSAVHGGPVAAAATVATLVLNVSIDAAVEDPDDSMLDDVEAALALARRGLAAEGFELAVAGVGALVATKSLPAAPDAQAAARAELGRRAERLMAQLQMRPRSHPAVHVALTIDDAAAVY